MARLRLGGAVTGAGALTRIAVISDVHGGLVALEAVIADLRRQSPDVVVHGGDLVFNGPRPAEVVDRIRELGWPGVIGNTDESVWWSGPMERALSRSPGLLARLSASSRFAAERLGDERIDWLRSQPESWQLDAVRLVHASPNDLWNAPGPDATDQELTDTYAADGVEVAVYGHIHRPYVCRIGALVVANSGSAGMTFDGDPRASYLLIDGDQVTVHRVEYDVSLECRDLTEVGHPGADWLSEMRRIAAPAWPG
ncbi:MAG: metallophosphoesterase family protein [Candidatus Dormibacteria bacterium]